MILDLFAGPGGWDVGAAWLGRETLGFELDADACATRAAAGLATVQADVAAVDLAEWARMEVEGLIASPPCQSFSLAGKQLGDDDLPRIFAAIRGWPEAWSPDGWADPRSALILEPLRWAWTLRPRWVACEQVKPCLPVWRALGAKLEEVGYRWWAGVLNAADYGVPQTRERAIFIASLDGQPRPPAATHNRAPTASLFGATLEPWVSMATALGWGDFDMAYQRGAGMIERHGERPMRPSEEPAPTLTGSALGAGAGAGAGAKMSMVVRTGANSMGTGRTGSKAGDGDVQPYERSLDEPAPTLDAKVGAAWSIRTNNVQSGEPGTRHEQSLDRPAPTVATRADLWTIDARQNGARIRTGDEACRTLTGIAESKGIWKITDPDGHRIRLTIADALTLQSFPPNYPLQGTKTAKFRQIGDAVPPRLAQHILATLLRYGA